MTFDAMSNSPSHSQLHTRNIWKEKLVIYQKSLKAFLQVSLQLWHSMHKKASVSNIITQT